MPSFFVLLLLLLLPVPADAAETYPHYYAHPAVADAHGVIAPWYRRQNGQFDYRVRIAVETLKRYPWAGKDKAVAPAPEYIFNGHWKIDHEGTIAADVVKDWNNGDLSQRAAHLIGGLIDYYAYSGDPAVFMPITAMADYLLDYCQTDDSHGWPKMLISVPTYGTHYGRCRLGPSEVLKDGQGKIQLDNLAQVGIQFVRASELTGNTRWYEAAKHWADLIARNRDRRTGMPPWGRYANKTGGSGMNDQQTGGVVLVLMFLDEVIRTGYTGANRELVEARDAGRAYLRDTLLPKWTVFDTWGRNFWDWECPVQDVYSTEFPALYMMDHKAEFPNWRNDARNLLGLFIHHAGVSAASRGDVYHGAWAYPESSSCCGRSLWYSPMALAPAFARLGVEANDEWAREMARRQQILATYDPQANGQSMDLIDGGVMVNRSWFKIAHPMALEYVLRSIAWQPEIMAPNRENHIVRASGVIRRVIYGKGQIVYSTSANSTEVLRLAFEPASVTANGKPLSRRETLDAPGFTVRPLAGGDVLVAIRHDGATAVLISGQDPQTETDDTKLSFDGKWITATERGPHDSSLHVSDTAGASMTYRFRGNQVRLIGRAAVKGGLADVYVDDVKQLVPVDCYSPVEVDRQVLYWRNGFENGAHALRVVARGAGNPLSKGSEIYIDAVQSSDATGDSGFGEGGGPKDAQRMIFGYTGRDDYLDSAGNRWRPATEAIVRTGHNTDAVARTWWTMRQAVFVTGTPDAEPYRYGIHHQEIRVPLTVGPGAYHLRLKFLESQFNRAGERLFTIWVNGQKKVEGFDVFATAGAVEKPVDLVFNGIQPKNGMVELRLAGDEVRGRPAEAMIQALELGPGDGGEGATPKISQLP